MSTLIVILSVVAVVTFALVWVACVLTGGLLSFVRRLSGRAPTTRGSTTARASHAIARLARWTAASRRVRLVTAVIAVFCMGVVAGRVMGGPADARQFALLRQAWDILHEHYVQPADLDAQAMAYTAIEGMAWAVGDEDHTVFLSPDAALAASEALSTDADPVDWAMLPTSSVALIRLEVFAHGSSERLGDAIVGALGAGADGLVLDLRGNPGGSIDEAVWAMSDFVASGPAVQMRDRSGTVRVAYVDGGVIDSRIPLAVLIDGDTASAAEMVAAGLQEAGRAALIGEKTFGTGTGLAAYYLADGSLLEVGEGAWLTRNGTSVWHTGVQPDILISTAGSILTPEKARSATPAQLEIDTGLTAAASWLRGAGAR